MNRVLLISAVAAGAACYAVPAAAEHYGRGNVVVTFSYGSPYDYRYVNPYRNGGYYRPYSGYSPCAGYYAPYSNYYGRGYPYCGRSYDYYGGWRHRHHRHHHHRHHHHHHHHDRDD